MNRDGLLELRVLSGIHAGARALLLLSAGPLQLGSSSDCELILSDEGVLADHASLVLSEDGSIVLRWGQGDMPAVVLRPGEGFWAGPVQIAVERVDAPWREPVCLHAAQASPPGRDTDASALEDAGLSSQSVPRHRRAWRLAIATAGAILGIALGVLMVSGIRAPHEPASTALPPAHRAASAPIDAISAAIDPLGLRMRVTIDRSDPQAPVVRTRFLTDDEAQILALSVSRLSPRPRIVAASEDELLAAVAAAAQDMAGGEHSPLTVRALGGSRFRVEGRVADEARRAQVITALERAFPDAPGFDYGLTTDEEAATAMLDELQKQSGAKVRGRREDGKLRLQALVPEGGQARWESMLQAAAARHGVLFEASVTTAPGRADTGSPASLPFTVRSVVSGATPYLVLADGRQLMPGARHEGWVLTDIRPDAIRFENPQGQKIVLER